jgi:hypothetical protein
MRQVYQLPSKRSNVSGAGYSSENNEELIASHQQTSMACSLQFLAATIVLFG